MREVHERTRNVHVKFIFTFSECEGFVLVVWFIVSEFWLLGLDFIEKPYGSDDLSQGFALRKPFRNN